MKGVWKIEIESFENYLLCWKNFKIERLILLFVLCIEEFYCNGSEKEVNLSFLGNL